ncbi:MAG TPA: SDR family NAD(P)-dependent oxidoreductase [Aldersonia sp.]
MVEAKSAVVTGGAQGIGLAIGRRLAQHGATSCSSTSTRAEAAAKELSNEMSTTVVGLGCDVTDEDAYLPR